MAENPVEASAIVRHVEWHSLGWHIPLTRLEQEPPHLRMDEPDADGQFPTVSESVQSTGQSDVDQVARVLPDPPQIPRGSPRYVEPLRQSLGQPGDERRQHKPDEEQVRISVKRARADPGLLRIEVKGRRILQRVEEISQRGRRVPHSLFITFHSRIDQAMPRRLVDIGECLHRGIRRRVSDARVLDIGVGQIRGYLAGSLVSGDVRRGSMCRFSQSSLSFEVGWRCFVGQSKGKVRVIPGGC